MNLILIRHGNATWEGREWKDDYERPLTEVGKREATVVGAALRRAFESVDQLLTSPLLRARETAEIIASVSGWPRPRIHDPASSNSDSVNNKTWAKRLFESFQEIDESNLAYVGHDPTLSQLITLLLTGEEEPAKVEMKRAAAALIRFDGPVAPNAGYLGWLVVPKLLGQGTA